MKKKKKKRIIKIVIISAVILALLICGLIIYKNCKTLLSQVSAVKSSAKDIIGFVKTDEPKKAQDELSKIESSMDIVDGILSKGAFKLASFVPFAKPYFKLKDDGFALARDVIDNLGKPGLQLLETHTISDLVSDDGYNVGTIMAFLNFFDEKLSYIKDLLSDVRELDISVLDEDGSIKKTIDGYVGMAEEGIGLYEENGELIDFLRIIFGKGEDKRYLLVAQNSAEIRGAGGFAGALCNITIEDGILKMGDFDSWPPFFKEYTPASANLTLTENYMFDWWMTLSRDVEFNPDFSRVGEVWTCCYYDRTGQRLDGVISLTPHIIQEILKAVGSITIADGKVLDGTNATKILQEDLYFEYQGADSDAMANNDMVDALFSEAALKTLGKVFDDISLDSLKGLIDAFYTGINNRYIMVYMDDAKEEQFMKDMGCSGAFSLDPQKPELGLYFSSYDGARLGLFTYFDIEIGDPYKNYDGSYSYPVRVGVTNTMTEDEYRRGGDQWICGHFGGSIASFIDFVAPADGWITDFWSDAGIYVVETDYRDHHVGYANNFFIDMGETINFYFTVITAPGADAPLGVNHTPFLQDYR